MPVSKVKYSTAYTWWVNVTDGDEWTNSSFTFTTGKEGWYNTAWRYRKTVTIDSDMVTESLDNFTALVNFDDPDLAAKAQSDGDDIIFTSTDNTVLSHETESYGDGEPSPG